MSHLAAVPCGEREGETLRRQSWRIRGHSPPFAANTAAVSAAASYRRTLATNAHARPFSRPCNLRSLLFSLRSARTPALARVCSRTRSRRRSTASLAFPGCSLPPFQLPSCPFDEGSSALGAKHTPPLNTRALIGPPQPPLSKRSSFIFPLAVSAGHDANAARSLRFQKRQAATADDSTSRATLPLGLGADCLRLLRGLARAESLEQIASPTVRFEKPCTTDVTCDHGVC
ncbi:hypothetical protein HBH98_108540 [Parastagonospora nodorum]|nr:hypothetical protein HBH98_108540 [Parastagonospora nodorum]KAH4376872.1 hypothetical protein HBH97_114650 [Parastagonospora nodorum]KAH4396905.1 hypothetical protein HBH99_115850 [Parastagonospora nodorum]KAH5252255.1 hypothetical protein HBI72_148490 [Parastagonospora nodorum]KAH5330473.1 hypothetical protein HBI50_067450 [Parastagonospora nodorum]